MGGGGKCLLHVSLNQRQSGSNLVRVGLECAFPEGSLDLSLVRVRGRLPGQFEHLAVLVERLFPEHGHHGLDSLLLGERLREQTDTNEQEE